MSNENLEFEELRYTPAVESLYLVAIWTAVALAYSSCVAAAYQFSKDVPPATGIAVLLLGGGWILAIAIFIPAFISLRPRAVLLIRLTTHMVAIDRFGKLFEVPFNDVRRVSFRSIPAIGAWFVLHLKDGKRARFSAGVIGSQRVLESLRRANPPACSETELLAFRMKARALANSWLRFQRALDAWPWLIVKYFCFPALAGVALPDLVLILHGNPIHTYIYRDSWHFLFFPVLISLFIAGLAGTFIHWLRELVLRIRDLFAGPASDPTGRALVLGAEALYYFLVFVIYACIFFQTH